MTDSSAIEIARALRDADMDGEDTPALSESLMSCGRHLKLVAHAISSDAAPGHDAAGGTVVCLTEAVMGITAGLVQIAGAVADLAEAVRERGDK